MISLKRTIALARAEWLQFRRNKTLLFMALTFPIGMALLVWFSIDPQTEADKRAAGGMMMEIYFLGSLFMVLFYSVLSMAATRRDERVLKRLCTGEARDAEILVAIVVPGAIVTIGFFVLVAAIAITLGSIPENLWLTVLALILGIVIFGALAFLTCCFTKNAEAAQVTSMPVMALAVISMSNLRSLVPEKYQTVLDRLPVSPIYDLAVLGWAGNDREIFLDAPAPFDLGQIFAHAVPSLITAAMWIVLLIWSVAVYMRWDTHRG